MQKSQSFLLPSLKVTNKGSLYSNTICTYCGNREYEGAIGWGTYFYVLIKSDAPMTLITELRSLDWYVTEYDPTEDSIMFVLEPDEESKYKLFRPFIQGKYSEMDRVYMSNNFNYKTATGDKSLNWKIHVKDKRLKEYWEERIGVELPEDAEVWNAPKLEDEVYGYNDQTSSLGVQLYQHEARHISR